MQYTRRELLDLVLDFVGENNDTNARNTAERLLNIAIQDVWMKHAWQQFDMPSPYTFATVSGTASYPLPAYFGRVRDGIIRNQTTGARIFPTSLRELQERIPAAGISALDSGGAPEVYAIGGTVGVDVQVATAGEAVTAASDDADDTNVRVVVEGLDSDGRYRRTQTTLNGTSSVALGTWKKIINVSKALPSGTDPATELTSSQGNVTITGASSGTLVVLASYESAVERMELTLWPTPNAVWTISVPILRAPHKLLYDADVTPLGWGPCLLETLDLLWKVNSGELKQMPPPHARPALIDLIVNENGNRFAVPARTRAFLG